MAKRKIVLRHAAPKYLAKMIKSAVASHGFVGIIVYGLQGAGKSTLALWTAYYALGNWDKVFKYLFFDIYELLELLTTAPPNYTYPLLIADDAGVHMGKYLYKTDVKRADFVSKLIQVARTKFNAIIFTTPHPNMLTKSIRDQPDWIYVRVRKIPRRQAWPPISAIKIYKSIPSPRNVYVAKLQDDEIPFTVWLPDKVYHRYMQIRYTYTDRVINDFIENVLQNSQKG